MSDLEATSMDFVRELRLRQWARQNYVPLEARRVSWHPVVLDEMLRRDNELASEIAPADSDPSSPAPNEMAIAVAEVGETDEAIETDASFDSGIGSRFVPLVPDTHFRFDEGCGDIPKPHAWARAAHSRYSAAFGSFSSID